MSAMNTVEGCGCCVGMREKSKIGEELYAWTQQNGTALLMPTPVYEELVLLATNNMQCNHMDWVAHKRRCHHHGY